jgi:hypothetical protein
MQVPLMTWLSVCFHWSAGQVACKVLCQSNARANLTLPDKECHLAMYDTVKGNISA